MANKSSNKNLHQASKAKKDEFYIQLSDIEKELGHYKKHFKNKVVFCNCDDPRVSDFFHYFSYNFENLGLKKLIATCYKNQNADLFSQNKVEKAVYLEYTGDKNGDKIPELNEIGIKELKGDGDLPRVVYLILDDIFAKFKTVKTAIFGKWITINNTNDGIVYNGYSGLCNKYEEDNKLRDNLISAVICYKKTLNSYEIYIIQNSDSIKLPPVLRDKKHLKELWSYNSKRLKQIFPKPNI